MERASLTFYLENDRPFIPFQETLRLVRKERTLLVWSLFIFLLVFLFSFLVLPFFTRMIEANVHFVIQEPKPEDGALWSFLWSLMKSLFSLLLKGISFFLAFTLSYPLVAPFYQVISSASEDLFQGRSVALEELPDLEDLLSEAKVALVPALLAFGSGLFSLIITFIPLIGPLLSFTLTGLLFFLLLFRFSPSRHGWDLRQTMSWILDRPRDLMRLALLPALSLLVPIITPFLVGMASSLFIVHFSLSFSFLKAHQGLEAKNRTS